MDEKGAGLFLAPLIWDGGGFCRTGVLIHPLLMELQPRRARRALQTIRPGSVLSDHAKQRAIYYTDGLTGLRGVAAFWVFLYHMWVTATPRHITIDTGLFSVVLTPFFSCGWAGVDIFYTLSGFLLTLPFAKATVEEKRKVEIGPYFRRRILRVFPAYYAQLGILLALGWFGIYGRLPKADNLVAHLFMAHHIRFEYFTAMNGVWWTLPIEFSFYLVLPILALLLRRHRWPILLAGAVVLSVSYRFLAFQFIPQESVPYKVWVLEQLPGRVDQFVFGMLGAYFFVKGERREGPKQSFMDRIPSALFFISGAIGIVVSIYLLHFYVSEYWNGHFLLFIWHGCVGFSVALLIYGIARNSFFGRFLFGNKLILFVGVISYSLYLWHLIVIEWLMRWNYLATYKGYLFPFLFVIAVPLALAGATLSYILFERPFLVLQRTKR